MASGSRNFMIVDPPDVQLPVETQRPMESIIKLSNISVDEMIFFKVRTTDQAKYCVQPTNGVIWPNCSTTVSITCPTSLNPPEVGRSSDLFSIQHFKLKLTDVASRIINLDASTAFVEFQKQSPKPEINQLRLNVCFVASKPINHNEANLVVVKTELGTADEGRRKLEKELVVVRTELGTAVRTELGTAGEGRRKLEEELAAVRTKMGTTGEGRRKLEKELAAVRTDLGTADEGRRKLEEELLMLRAHNESMSLHLNLMQKDVIICNEDKERFKKARDTQEKVRVIMEKERDTQEKKALCCTIVILLAIMVSCYLKT